MGDGPEEVGGRVEGCEDYELKDWDPVYRVTCLRFALVVLKSGGPRTGTTYIVAVGFYPLRCDVAGCCEDAC